MLVEDDEVDAMTVRRALKGLHGGNPLVRLENGKEAPGYLRQPGRVMPCLILLDLDMPAVVLTTSEEPQDKLASFDPGVTGYVSKYVASRLTTRSSWKRCAPPTPTGR